MTNSNAANHWRAVEEEKLRKRIKELGAANDIWRRDFAALRAENQRLHAAARATVLEWRKDIWPGDEHKCFMNNRMEELAALVGEKV